MRLDDRLNIGGHRLKSRIVTASGCRCTTLETIKWYSELIPDIGVFATKSIGPEPRKGNPSPIYCADPELGPGARRNAVGLANPGHEAFAEEAERMKDDLDLNGSLLLGSVFGANLEEIVAVSKSLAPYLDAIEINLSCPHAEGYGFDMSRGDMNESDAQAAIVNAVCRATGKDVFAKLSPNFPEDNLTETAKKCVEAGARGITVINTVGPGTAYLPGTSIPVLFNRQGGLSGPGINERGLQCTGIVRRAIGPDHIIIGMGGIYSGEDARNYLAAGADLVGIGTVMEGFSSGTLSAYVSCLHQDIEQGTDNARMLLSSDINLAYSPYEIKCIDRLSGDLRVLTFNKNFNGGRPGQYVFLAVPGNDGHPTMEAPFSVPKADPLTLAIRLHPRNDREHHFTSRVWEQQVGDTVYIRGPYGAPFNVSPSDNIYVVGGGTGTAALLSIARQSGSYLAFVGGKTQGELLFADNFGDFGVFATEEKSPDNYHGFVTGAFADIADGKQAEIDYVVTCGPVPMMEAAVKIANEKGFEDQDIHVVLEPYMKCGVGICGACALPDGRISCTDGHIVTADRFKAFLEQGKVSRDACGGWERS